MSETQSTKAAGGVETLIQKLRQEGVAKGEAEAQALVAAARQQADALLREAATEAENIRSTARQQAERLDVSGREALAIAFRDSVIRLRDELTRSFQEEVGRLVGRELEQAEVIRQLLLQLGALCREQAHLDQEPAYTVQLPAHLVGLEELRAKPEELEHGGLTRLVSSLAANLLREGVVFHPNPHQNLGIRLFLKDRKSVV